MKKYLLRMIMAVFVFIAMLPVKVLAVESAIEVTGKDTGTASVKLTLPNAASEGISTFSLSLMLEPTDGGINMDEIVSGVEFGDRIKQEAKVQTSRSHQGKMLNIYVAGIAPLFTAGADGDTLEVGEVYMRNAAGENVPFQIDVGKSEFSVVRGRTTVKIGEDDLNNSSGGTPIPPEEPDPSEEPDPPAEPVDPEIQAVREQLKALLEKAESIPEGNRTPSLQAAIDKAKSVLGNPDATLEELKAALMELENELALYGSTVGSENQTEDTGRAQARQNQRQNGTPPAAKTGDTDPVIPYAVMIVLCAAVLGAVGWHRRRAAR